MNQTHLHLLINHLPIFGSILGAMVLIHGLWTKSNPTKIAAYNLLIISTIGALIAYLTGEAAEESLENIQGISKDLIEHHEETAMVALGALVVLGISALLGLIFTLRKSVFSNTLALIILFLSLISFSLIARTGYIGGQIRHTEINSSNPSLTPASDHEDND